MILGGTREQRAKLIIDYNAAGHSRPVHELRMGNQIWIGDIRLMIGLWPRFVARATLGAVSLLDWSEAWLQTATARQLRSWVFDDRPATDSGDPLLALPRRPPAWLAPVCRDREHRLVFFPGASPEDSRSVLHVVLFGRDWFGVMIDAHGFAPAARAAWRIPLGRAAIRQTYHDVVDESFVAFADRNSEHATAEPKSRADAK
jgi:hypothetical protein